MKKFIIILFLLLSHYTYSQTCNMVAMLDMGKVSIKAGNNTGIDNFFAGSLGFRFNIADKFALEFRPGILLYNDDYSGFHYGFLGRYYLVRHFYGVAGINFHFQDSYSYGTGVKTDIFRDEYSELYLGLAFTTGHLGLNFGYYHPFTKLRGQISYLNDTGDIAFSDLYVNYAIRLGIEVGFVID